MTENGSDFFGPLDEPDLEVPQDGRNGQSVEEGSSDEPQSLEAHDPLRNEQGVLSDTYGLDTISEEEGEPIDEDDWVLEDEEILDPDELDDTLEEDFE